MLEIAFLFSENREFGVFGEFGEFEELEELGGQDSSVSCAYCVARLSETLR